MASTSLFFDIFGRDHGVGPMFDRVGGHAQRLNGVMAGVGGAIGGVVGGVVMGGLSALGEFAKKFTTESVGVFASLEDASQAAGAIFGNNMTQISGHAEGAAQKIGMSKNAVVDAANTFGIFGKSAGLAGQPLTDFSLRMVDLAGDMASFKGVQPEVAVQAIGSAMRGEMEPIRQFGILLDDATLRNRALEMGLISTTKNALTPQQKVLAAQAEILAQTTIMQGDFARTSESTANTQKRLAAETENLQAKVGGLLAPAFTAARGAAINFVQGASGLIDKIGPGIEMVSAAVGPLVSGFFQLAGSVSPVHIIMSALQPILPQLFAAFMQIAQVVGGALPPILAALAPLFSAVTGAVTALISAFLPLIPLILQIVSAVIPPLISVITALIPVITAVINQAIVPLVRFLGEVLPPVIRALLPIVTAVFNAVAAIVTSAMQIVQGIINVVLGIITGDWSRVWQGIQQILAGVWNTIVAIVQGALGILGAVIGAALNLIGQLFSTVWNNIVNAVRTAITAVQVVVGATVASIAAGWSAAWNSIMAVVSAIWAGIRAVVTGAIQAVLGIVSGVMGAIVGVISATWNRILAVVSAVVNAVRAVIGAVLAGIQALWSGYWNTVIAITSGVFNTIRNVIAGAMNAVMGVVNSIMGGIRNVVVGGLSAVVRAGISGAAGFLNAMRNGFMQAVWAVQGAVGNLMGVVISIPGRILGALAWTGNMLWQVGRNIISGLARGIWSAAGMIFEAVRGVVGNVVGFAKKILGIGSPSKVMDEEVGQWIPPGIGNGVLRAMPKLRDAMARVGREIQNGVKDPTFNVGVTGTGGSTAGVVPRSAVLTAEQLAAIKVAVGGGKPDLDGLTLELNADATMVTFKRIASTAASSAVQDANDDLYRGRAR